MAAMTFNTPENQTIGRHLLVAHLNTGSAEAPKWSPIGYHISESDMEYDWQKESITDILNNIWTTMKTPIINQNFQGWPLSNGDEAVAKIWNLAVWEQDAPALCAQDMLIVHKYAGAADTAMAAERYTACAVEMTRKGGSGGGTITIDTNVTFGGVRTLGTASVGANGTVTFTAN